MPIVSVKPGCVNRKCAEGCRELRVQKRANKDTAYGHLGPAGTRDRSPADPRL